MAISLEVACDALDDAVWQFHNEMLRRGVKELSPRQWAEEFRSWLDPHSFECLHEENVKFLAEFDERNK